MTDPTRLPRCDMHDVERLWCPADCPLYGDGFTMTPQEHALLSAFDDHQAGRPNVFHIADLERSAGRRLHEVRFTYRSQPWRDEEPQPTRCDDSHQKPPGAALCPDCDETLERLLGDVPAIVEDLNAAITKQVRFVQHGTRPADTDPETGQPVDEAPLPFNPAASSCLSTLAQALEGDPIPRSRWMLAHPYDHDRARTLTHLSMAMSKAHRTIDRPPDPVHVGGCPRCTLPLETQRGHQVTCPCGYTESWRQHIDNTLAERLDTLLTVSELVPATGLTRDQVKNLTRRMEGVKVQRPHLDGWYIRSTEVTMYRLGTVLAEKERRDTRTA